MYSPRSVSTTVMPAASIAWSSADSSLTIDFDLMILRTPWREAMSRTSALTSAGVCAHSTVAPRAAALASKFSSQTSRSSSARLRIALPASRVASKSSSSESDARRLLMNFPCILERLCCRSASCSLTWAVSLKCIEAICISDPRNPPPDTSCLPRLLAGEDLGHVQHLRLGVAAAAQAPLDVQHAAEVAEHDRVGAAGLDVLALVVGEVTGDLAEFDRERAAEPAAGLALGHLPEPE